MIHRGQRDRVRSIADAHVLLIGTGSHDTPPGGDRLVDVPSVATTLADRRAAFTERCALPAVGYAYCPIPPIRLALVCEDHHIRAGQRVDDAVSPGGSQVMRRTG
jgi:hypothetical protein